MAEKKKLSILDQIAAAEDVAEQLVEVPEWGVSILFRGLSLATLQGLRGLDMQAAQNGDIGEAIKMVQATATDPDTKLPIFAGEKGYAILAQKNYEVITRLLTDGALVVLGIDENETAGKG